MHQVAVKERKTQIITKIEFELMEISEIIRF